MNTQEKIEKVNKYVENFLFRKGFSLLGKVSLNCKFWITNITNESDNYFKVDSEKEAKEIVKVFLTNSYTEDVFKDFIFSESKPLYLALDIQLPM
ncbi:hypothetical protein [Flavobacterium tegetincola]|uniref:hypothetical protein n=1 Tax=Flavobacterium tegetincola TaxID=150172 RepID=UPI000422D441|nr:hypothetical protein [Flavobacterium tegetincola]